MAEQKLYFINTKTFQEFVKTLLPNSIVIAPTLFNDTNRLAQITPENINKIYLFGFRAIESFKSFFFKITEKVAEYFLPADRHGNNDSRPHPTTNNLSLIGARACDLEALNITDRVYLEGDFVDAPYANNRKNTLIISADCTDAGLTCFCTLVGGKPYPEKWYDINLIPIKEGFVVEAGSDIGCKIITDNPDYFDEAYSDQIDAVKRSRRRVMNHLDDKNRPFRLRLKFSETHKANLLSRSWKTLTKDCVECSACNFICPTCTCFLLTDEACDAVPTGRQDKNCRSKVWDACLKCSYAKVAGGGNPRPMLYERLQNRYHCKFDYSFDRLDRYTCVGCGRCIDGCAGNIDMRKIFKELEKTAALGAILE